MKKRTLVTSLLVVVILLSATPSVQAGGPTTWVFSPPVRINGDTGNDWEYDPTLALNGKDKIFAAWALVNNQTGSAANSGIEFTRSNDGGDAWKSATAVAGESVGLVQVTPDLAADGKDLHMVWSHFPVINYSRSSNGGKTWSGAKPIKAFSGDISVSPRIFVRQGVPHVVWSESGADWRNTSIWYATTANGSDWQASLVTSSDQWEWHFNDPEVIVTSQAIYVVWQWDVPGKCQIYFSVSYDAGQTWSEPRPISTAKKAHLAPKLAADRDTAYVVWATPPSSIMFSSSINNGLTWSEPLTVAEGPRAYDTDIAAGDCRIFVSYVSGATAEQEAITIIESKDGGQIWQAVGQPDRPTTATGEICGHQIAATKKAVYVVWSQWADYISQYDVFFASAHQLNRAFLPAIERGLVIHTID